MSDISFEELPEIHLTELDVVETLNRKKTEEKGELQRGTSHTKTLS